MSGHNWIARSCCDRLCANPANADSGLLLMPFLRSTALDCHCPERTVFLTPCGHLAWLSTIIRPPEKDCRKLETRGSEACRSHVALNIFPTVRISDIVNLDSPRQRPHIPKYTLSKGHSCRIIMSSSVSARHQQEKGTSWGDT